MSATSKITYLLAGSTAVAAVVAVALLLRPSHTIWSGSEMSTPEHIPPAARAVIRSKMSRHRAQLGDLVSSVIVLDYDGAARAAGAIFDEPALARPITGDELNGLLPERFFELQDQLGQGARALVEAAARKDAPRLGEEFGRVTKTCIACHDLYLHAESPVPAPR
jgi:hypothetical protein